MANNKLTGSFYTPHKLIEYMVDYVSKRMKPCSILEPSAGDGRFVSLLLKFNAPITLVEFEPDKANYLSAQFGEECSVWVGDFLKYSL